MKSWYDIRNHKIRRQLAAGMTQRQVAQYWGITAHGIETILRRKFGWRAKVEAQP